MPWGLNTNYERLDTSIAGAGVGSDGHRRAASQSPYVVGLAGAKAPKGPCFSKPELLNPTESYIYCFESLGEIHTAFAAGGVLEYVPFIYSWALRCKRSSFHKVYPVIQCHMPFTDNDCPISLPEDSSHILQ